MDDDPGQAGHIGAQALEYPTGEVLAGGIIQAIDIVEIVVIEAIVERLETRLEVAEIHDPSENGIGRPFHMQLHAERVPMQPCTLVPFGHIRQTVGCLDVECLEDAHRTGSEK